MESPKANNLLSEQLGDTDGRTAMRRIITWRTEGTLNSVEEVRELCETWMASHGYRQSQEKLKDAQSVVLEFDGRRITLLAGSDVLVAI